MYTQIKYFQSLYFPVRYFWNNSMRLCRLKKLHYEFVGKIFFYAKLVVFGTLKNNLLITFFNTYMEV